MGSGDRHLTLSVRQGGKSFRVVAFGKGEMKEELSAIDGPIDLAFHPVINEFRGFRKVELHLIDWRPSQSPVSTES